MKTVKTTKTTRHETIETIETTETFGADDTSESLQFSARPESSQTTTHAFASLCPNQTLGTPEQLANPEVTLQVSGTTTCDEGHTTHLDYGSHARVRVCDLSVPGDTFTMDLLWRSGVTEVITVSRVSGSTTASKVDDSGKTTVTFNVPSSSQGTTTWLVSAGDPGFDLTVKVKRK